MRKKAIKCSDYCKFAKQKIIKWERKIVNRNDEIISGSVGKVLKHFRIKITYKQIRIPVFLCAHNKIMKIDHCVI